MKRIVCLFLSAVFLLQSLYLSSFAFSKTIELEEVEINSKHESNGSFTFNIDEQNSAKVLIRSQSRKTDPKDPLATIRFSSSEESIPKNLTIRIIPVEKLGEDKNIKIRLDDFDDDFTPLEIVNLPELRNSELTIELENNDSAFGLIKLLGEIPKSSSVIVSSDSTATINLQFGEIEPETVKEIVFKIPEISLEVKDSRDGLINIVSKTTHASDQPAYPARSIVTRALECGNGVQEIKTLNTEEGIPEISSFNCQYFQNGSAQAMIEETLTRATGQKLYSAFSDILSFKVSGLKDEETETPTLPPEITQEDEEIKTPTLPPVPNPPPVVNPSPAPSPEKSDEGAVDKNEISETEDKESDCGGVYTGYITASQGIVEKDKHFPKARWAENKIYKPLENKGDPEPYIIRKSRLDYAPNRKIVVTGFDPEADKYIEDFSKEIKFTFKHNYKNREEVDTWLTLYEDDKPIKEFKLDNGAFSIPVPGECTSGVKTEIIKIPTNLKLQNKKNIRIENFNSKAKYSILVDFRVKEQKTGIGSKLLFDVHSIKPPRIFVRGYGDFSRKFGGKKYKESFEYSLEDMVSVTKETLPIINFPLDERTKYQNIYINGYENVPVRERKNRDVLSEILERMSRSSAEIYFAVLDDGFLKLILKNRGIDANNVEAFMNNTRIGFVPISSEPRAMVHETMHAISEAFFSLFTDKAMKENCGKTYHNLDIQTNQGYYIKNPYYYEKATDHLSIDGYGANWCTYKNNQTVLRNGINSPKSGRNRNPAHRRNYKEKRSETSNTKTSNLALLIRISADTNKGNILRSYNSNELLSNNSENTGKEWHLKLFGEDEQQLGSKYFTASFESSEGALIETADLFSFEEPETQVASVKLFSPEGTELDEYKLSENKPKLEDIDITHIKRRSQLKEVNFKIKANDKDNDDLDIAAVLCEGEDEDEICFDTDIFRTPYDPDETYKLKANSNAHTLRIYLGDGSWSDESEVSIR